MQLKNARDISSRQSATAHATERRRTLQQSATRPSITPADFMADALCMLFVSNYIMFFIIYTALYHTLYVSLTFYHPHHICISFQQFSHINISIYNNPHHPTSYHILHSSITLYPRSLCYSLLYHVLHAHAITSLPPPPPCLYPTPHYIPQS